MKAMGTACETKPAAADWREALQAEREKENSIETRFNLLVAENMQLKKDCSDAAERRRIDQETIERLTRDSVEAARVRLSLQSRNETLEREKADDMALVRRLTDGSAALRAKLEADAKGLEIMRASLAKANKRCEMAGVIAERLKKQALPGGRMAQSVDDLLSILDVADLPDVCSNCEYPLLLHDETYCPACNAKVEPPEPKDPVTMCDHDRRGQ
jgi:hypothetical protein